MNKNIFRNRTIIGAVCILLAVLVCFGITPLFNAGLKAQTEAVRVKAEVIPRGTYITADMVEVYTRGASGMSDAIATSLDEVVGRYTDVELRKNTDVNTGWLSSEPLTQYEYLTKLDGSKVAISVTIPTFAKGGSGKVEAGDIIMLFATDKDTGETTQPPELKYVEVLAATQSSGADKEYQAPQDDEEENPEESLPSTITLLVNTEQAQLLAHLEESNSLHLAFVYRGTRENAEKFLAAQDQFFVEPEEDTAAQDGEQGEVSDDIACQDDKSLKSTLTPIIGKLSDMRIVAAELDYLLYEPFKEFITMAFLLIGNIPLLYFLNKDWYDVLVNTGFGKGILAVCLLVLLISFAAVIRLTKPVEYKR